MVDDCKGLGYRLRQIEADIQQLESATIVRCGDLYLFDMSTTTASLQDAFVLNVDDATVVRVVWEADCRQGDGINRGSFRREALFFREGGDVNIQEAPHTALTIRSTKLVGVEYSLLSSSITFRVHGAGPVTHWKGCIHVFVVQ